MGVKNEEGAAPEAADTAGQESVQWEDLNSAVPGLDDEDAGEDDDEESSSESDGEGGDTDSAGDTDGEGEDPATATSGGEEGATDGEGTDGEAAPVVTEGTQEQAQELSPEQIAQRQADYDKWLGEQQVALEGMYAVDAELAEQLQTEPELVLPKLMAKLHLNVQRSLVDGMQQLLPRMVTQTQQATARETQTVNAFYEQFPELKPHHAKVLEIGKTYRQLNPKATPKEAMKAIGLLAAQMLEVDLKGKAKGKPSVPHKPTRPGGAAPKAAPKKNSGNVFADLLDD